jgi:hypothetical protein
VQRYYQIIILVATSMFQMTCIAAPMSYKGSNTTMVDISQEYSKIDTSYAITAKDSLGIRLYQAKGEGYKLNGDEFYYLRRLHRINAIESQANLWLFTSAGIVNVKKNNRNNNQAYVSPTVQADYETRRIYMMGSYQLFRVANDNFDTSKFKAGFSFYKTSYEETQPWFILELSHFNTINKKIEVIPTLRLINKALYFEAGVSTEGDPKLHLMYTF